MVGQAGTTKKNRDVEKSEIHFHALSGRLVISPSSGENVYIQKRGVRSNGDSTNLSQLLNKSS